MLHRNGFEIVLHYALNLGFTVMTERWIAPLSDNEILNHLLAFAKKYPEIRITINLSGSSLSFDDKDSLTWKTLSSVNGYAIQHLNVGHGRQSFAYSTNNNVSTHLAKLTANYNPQGQEVSTELIFAIEFQKAFGAPPSSGPKPSSELSYASGFLKIESALAGAVDRFADLQKSFQEKNQQLRDEHEKAILDLRVEIEGEKTALQYEIAQQRDELSAARKLIDDRSNTHARRAIRTELKESISDSLAQPSFAKNAETQRIFVRKIYIFSVLALCALAAHSIYIFSIAVSLDSNAYWITGIKASISSISAIGLILLYLRWETQWLTQQANFERVLSSTKVDIDRASWVAESLLEWNRESPEKEIPSELLQSFTRRLFDWDGKVEDHHSAQDSLASAILGSAAKLQIGPNGANIELDKKGIQKLDKV